MSSYQPPLPAHGPRHFSSLAGCMQETGNCFSKNITVCGIFLGYQVNFCLSPLLIVSASMCLDYGVSQTFKIYRVT